MCWESTTKPVKKVATEDIKVLKILYQNFYGYESPYRGEPYTIGEVKMSCISIESSYQYEIHKGLHSYSAKCRIDERHRWFGILSPNDISKYNDRWFCSKNNSLTLAVIPKGSVYYENEDGEIVSDKLKIVSKICSGDEIPENFFGTFEDLM